MAVTTQSMPAPAPGGHVRGSAHRRAAAAGLAGLMALVAVPALAVDALVLEAREVRAPGGVVLRDVTVRLDVPARGEPRARLRAARVDLPPTAAAASPIAGVALECRAARLSEPDLRCRGMSLRARVPGLGPTRIDGEALFRSDDGRFEVRGRSGRLVGSSLSFAARGDGSGWRVAASLPRAQVGAIRQLAGARLPLPADFALDGELDASLQARGTPAGVTSELELVARRVNFTNEAGTTVGENLSATLRLATRPAGRDTALALQLEAATGQALAGPALLDLAQNPLQADVRGTWAGGALRVEASRLEQKGLVSATAVARLTPLDDGPLVESADIDVRSLEFPAAYTSFLQIALADTDFGTLQLRGALRARAQIRDDAPSLLRAEFDGLQLEDARGKYMMRDLAGEAEWRPAGGPQAAISRLRWSAGSAYGLSGGAAGIEFRAQGDAFELTAPARLPVFDGALAVDTLSASGLGGGDLALRFEAQLEPVSLPQLTRAFGWPEFAGTVAGRIPRVEYRNRMLTFSGDIEARAFGGRIVGSNVRLEDPFGRWPRVFADVKVESVDLELVTRTFTIGTITGRLEGAVTGLELFAWSPVAFDAQLRTPPGDRGPHRISARAVGNLSNIGGGGGNVYRALQSGVFRLFDEYDYDELGIRCRLENEVCLMSGVEPAGIGYYILKGRGVPRIDIVGNAGRVNWPQLVSQITTQMRAGGAGVRVQ